MKCSKTSDVVFKNLGMKMSDGGILVITITDDMIGFHIEGNPDTKVSYVNDVKGAQD